MVKRHIVVKIFNNLVGDWSIDRTYSGDGVVSGSAKFSGTASLKKIDDVTILYSEVGELRADDGSVRDVSKCYYYSYDEEKDQITKWFYEGRDKKSLFYHLRFSEGFTKAYGEHLCGEDYYSAEYEFENNIIQSVKYRVTSSLSQEENRKKDYIISSSFYRL